jgi:hypothetical protein
MGVSRGPARWDSVSSEALAAIATNLEACHFRPSQSGKLSTCSTKIWSTLSMHS